MKVINYIISNKEGTKYLGRNFLGRLDVFEEFNFSTLYPDIESATNVLRDNIWEYVIDENELYYVYEVEFTLKIQ